MYSVCIATVYGLQKTLYSTLIQILNQFNQTPLKYSQSGTGLIWTILLL